MFWFVFLPLEKRQRLFWAEEERGWPERGPPGRGLRPSLLASGSAAQIGEVTLKVRAWEAVLQGERTAVLAAPGGRAWRTRSKKG